MKEFNWRHYDIYGNLSALFNGEMKTYPDRKTSGRDKKYV